MPRDALVIYHTADVHGRTGFGKKLAAMVEPDALLVDAGDALRGSSTVFFRNEPACAEFAEAGYRAQGVGNREFHYVHGWFRARAKAMPAPLICSNLIDLRDASPSFVPELRLAAGNFGVRLLALLVPQYRTGSLLERVFGWRFIAPEIALGSMLARVPAAADFTVLLSHLGLDADRRVAQRFPELSAIIGGHTHEALAQPEFVAGVPIVHAGPYARYVGRLELKPRARVNSREYKAEFVSYRLLPLLAGEEKKP